MLESDYIALEVLARDSVSLKSAFLSNFFMLCTVASSESMQKADSRHWIRLIFIIDDCYITIEIWTGLNRVSNFQTKSWENKPKLGLGLKKCPSWRVQHDFIYDIKYHTNMFTKIQKYVHFLLFTPSWPSYRGCCCSVIVLVAQNISILEKLVAFRSFQWNRLIPSTFRSTSGGESRNFGFGSDTSCWWAQQTGGLGWIRRPSL